MTVGGAVVGATGCGEGFGLGAELGFGAGFWIGFGVDDLTVGADDGLGDVRRVAGVGAVATWPEAEEIRAAERVRDRDAT